MDEDFMNELPEVEGLPNHREVGPRYVDTDEEIEIEISAPGVDIEIEIKPRYRDVGVVQANLLDMAKEILGNVEEIGNKRNESEEHEPNE